MTATSAQVAASVRAELARSGISARQLARDLGWNQATLLRRLHKTDPHPFKVTELEEIANHLGLPITAFFTSTDQVAS